MNLVLQTMTSGRYTRSREVKELCTALNRIHCLEPQAPCEPSKCNLNGGEDRGLTFFCVFQPLPLDTRTPHSVSSYKMC